jgi:hypothetical protein
MGEVLAMRRRLAGLLAAVLTLSACGDAAPDYDALRARLAQIGQGAAPQTDIRPAVAQLAARLPTARFIELPDRARLQDQPRLASQGVLVREEIVGDVATWLDPNRTMMSFRRGVLIGTRGLAGDLMSAEVGEVLAAIFGDAEQAVRVHRTLGGEEQLVINTFVCSYSRAPGAMTDPLVAGQPARLVVEDCIDSRGTRFENRYWIDGGGVIVQSTQWVSPDVGRLNTVLVKD